MRPPLTGRLTHIAIGALGAWMALVVTITLAGRGTIWALLAGLALVVWVLYFYRLISMVVLIRGDTLTVKNLLRTKHLTRSAIAEVTLGQSSVAKSPNQTVIVKTCSGQDVALDACARSMQSRRKRRRVEEFQRRVANWSLPDPRAAVAEQVMTVAPCPVPITAGWVEQEPG